MNARGIPADRLTRLEVKHDNLHALTEQIADTSSNTAKALQELVVIHREASVKAQADRERMEKVEKSQDRLWESHRKLHKVLWRYVLIGTGMAMVLATVWYAGLLPDLIHARPSLSDIPIPPGGE